MLNALPITMVRNEALWIAQILRPALAVFGDALVGDTGSTDGTAEIAEAAGATVLRLGPQTPAQLGRVREYLAVRAQARGADYGFTIDGDELYSEEALRAIYLAGLPPDKRTGFTLMTSVDVDEQGSYWELADLFCRQAVFPAGDTWRGIYPFESPVCYDNQNGFHYWTPPEDLRYHAVHLHRLQRSPGDGEVFMRLQKQKQFCLQDKEIPRVGPFDMTAWLAS